MTQSPFDAQRAETARREETLTTTTQEDIDLINEERAIGGQEPLTLDQVQQPQTTEPQPQTTESQQQTSESQPVPLQVIPFEEEPERQIRNQPSVTDPSTQTADQTESQKARNLLAGGKVDGVTFDLE